MAMEALVGAGMEVVDSMHAVRWMHVGRCRGHPESEVKTLMTTNHTTVQVRSSGKGLSGICRSSWKGLNTGSHEKAPVRCPCS